MTEKEIIDKYKYMFLDNFKFECGSGWNSLIYLTLSFLSDIDTKKLIEIFQIKEKLGGLRINLNYDKLKENLSKEEWEDIFNKIFWQLNQFEQLSYTLCENDGKSGKLRKDLDWIQTLCDDCYKLERDALNSRLVDLLCSGLLTSNDI
ncbi:MAG: hypothetical protein M0R17_03380 [Candidatus Omnitrophica bacterium]|jgi:hypothetical protein|nr:hypothetical protein [Candidatus Omnitrophota bacterium]